MNKKIVKIVLGVVAFFVAMAIVEISIRTIGASIQSSFEKKQEEKKQEELYNSETSVQSRETEKFIKNVYSAITDKQYEVVFNLLDITYKECFFENDVSNFKNYVENTMLLGEEYEIARITQKSKYANVLVRVKNGTEFKTQTCIVKITDNGENRIIFGDYSNITKSFETTANSTKVRYDLNYYFEVATQGVFEIKATNKTNEELSLNLTDAYLETTGGQKYYGTITETVEILPNETVELSVIYDKSLYSLNDLRFTETQNGKSENVYMLLDEIFGTDEE